MKASGSNRTLVLVAVTVIGLGLASGVGLYVAVQNKKSLPAVAQALMGGRLVHITTQGMYPTLKSGDTVAFDSRAYLDHRDHSIDSRTLGISAAQTSWAN